MTWDGLTISVVVVILTIAALLLLRAYSLQERSGLPAGQLIYTDTGIWFRNSEALHASSQRLVGKPDYLVQQENGEIIPVEIKSGSAPATPWPGHIMQIAAYCWLVAENYGVRPSFGIIQYQDQAFSVEYSPDLEQDLLNLLREMRNDHHAATIDRSHHDRQKCVACGYSARCRQRIT